MENKTTVFFMIILLTLTLLPMCKKNAKAAGEPKLNPTFFTLYQNENNPGNVPTTKQIKIQNIPANLKRDYTMKWSATDSTIVEVDGSAITAKVTAIKVGTTNIVCEITKKTDPNESYTIKSKVTVKASAEKIVINNAPENNIMYVGDVFNFNRTMTSSTGGPATDKTEWVISDTTLASVNNGTGEVTALKPGTFIIWAFAYQNEETKAVKDWVESPEVEIVIKNKITEVAAPKFTQLKVMFASATKNAFTSADCRVTNNATEQKIGVQSMELSEDKKTVLLTLSEPLKHGESYTVTCDGMRKTFDFTVGEAASVEFSDMRIPTGESTEVLFCVRDSNGLDITDIEKENCVITATKGTLNGFYLTLDEEVGSEVTVTYTNPETKETFKSEGTITGIHKVVSVTGCVIAKASESFLPDFSIINTVIKVGETDQKLYVKMKDSFGHCFVAGNDPAFEFTYESLSPEIITVDEEGVLTPIKAGIGGIRVYLKSDTSMSVSFAVCVKEKAYLDSLTLESAFPYGSLTNAMEPSEQHRMNYPYINVISKDQYSNAFPVDKLTFELQSGDDIIAYHGEALNASNKTIEITDGVTYFEPLKEGTVQFRVSKNNIARNGSLSINEEDTAVAGYKIVGCKSVDKALAWDEAGAAGHADHLELSLYEVNKDGFYINQIKCDGVTSKLVIDQEGIELSLQENGAYLLSKDEVKGLKNEERKITAFIGTEMVATSVFIVKDSFINPEVNLIKFQISGKLLNTETISQCFLLPERYAVAGFSFTSSNQQVLDDAGTFVTEIPYKAFYPNESVSLTGLKLKILCPSGRTFFIEGFDSISVTPPVREITSYEKLMNCVKEVEAYTEDVLLQKTTASRSMLTEALEEAKDCLENVEIGTSEAESALLSALTKLQSAIDGLKEKATTVRLACNPADVGEINGAGDYAIGDTVNISASAVYGYTFDGWYVDGDKKAELPASFTITVTEAHTTLSYEARYVENTKMSLTIETGNGSVLCEIDGVNETWTEAITKEYALGTHITLTAQAGDGETFLYWVDQTGKVITDSEGYSFFITGPIQIRAVYKEQEEKHCVVFKDINGKILSCQNILTGGSAQAPPHGNFIGYQFTGWDKELDNITQDLIITAVYEKMSGYTLEVTNGTIVDAKSEYTYGAYVTVKAEETKSGRYFSGWYLNNDTLVSDHTEYSFCLVENTKLTARFEGEAKLIPEPRFFLTMSERVIQTDGNQAIQLNHTWNVPDGYIFLEAGLVFTLTEVNIDELKIEAADGTNVYKKYPTTRKKEGTYAYTLTLGPNSQKKNVYIKGYLMYMEEEKGNIVTEYTSLYTSNANP